MGNTVARKALMSTPRGSRPRQNQEESHLPAFAEAVKDAIENAGVRLDLALALIGGMLSYSRLKLELTPFFSQSLPQSRAFVGDLYVAAFGSYAPEGLLVLGVLSGAALAFVISRTLFSVGKILFPDAEPQVIATTPPPRLYYRLPPWPLASAPQFVMGEEHQPDGTFCMTPRWHVIPLKGLVGSVLVVGAPGTAKTAAVILPFLDQLTEFRAHDPAHKVALFVLDRKGSLAGTWRCCAWVAPR
jgi:hypothetical protein